MRYAGHQRSLDNAAFTEAEDLASDELAHEPDSNDELFSTQVNTVETECTRWYKEPRVSPHTDIIQFWASKAYDYPIMSQMAKDYLAIPATSAASERVFSNASDIITKKRNRLSPDTLCLLLCLRSWGVIPDTELEEDEEDIRGLLV